MDGTAGLKRPLHLLLCCTGSVACVKVPSLVSTLLKRVEGSEIRIVFTSNSLHFIKLDELRSMHTDVKTFGDDDEWTSWSKMGDPVLHIELRKWADCLLIAPLDANTLAKLAGGLCDNLLTSIVRAWDITANKPLLFAPAMNTAMWSHPITSQHIETLKSWGYLEISPISKKLACGDEGIGAMCDVDSIVDNVIGKCKL